MVFPTSPENPTEACPGVDPDSKVGTGEIQRRDDGDMWGLQASMFFDDL